MFRVLYTKQLLKKRKTYHDGTLRTHPTRNIAVLHSDSDDVLCEVVCNLDKCRSWAEGDTLTEVFDGYIVVIDDVVEPYGGGAAAPASAQAPAPAAPAPPPSKKAPLTVTQSHRPVAQASREQHDPASPQALAPEFVNHFDMNSPPPPAQMQTHNRHHHHHRGDVYYPPQQAHQAPGGRTNDELARILLDDILLKN
ncbi:DUF2439 domain-containing protein [Pycnococcus provasolii]